MLLHEGMRLNSIKIRRGFELAKITAFRIGPIKFTLPCCHRQFTAKSRLLKSSLGVWTSSVPLLPAALHVEPTGDRHLRGELRRSIQEDAGRKVDTVHPTPRPTLTLHPTSQLAHLTYIPFFGRRVI